jgi:hypothetical protein
VFSPPDSKIDQNNMTYSVFHCVRKSDMRGSGRPARWNESILFNMKGLNMLKTNKQGI